MSHDGARLKFRLLDLVERFGGVLHGDPEQSVTGFAPLESAGPDQLAFLSNPRYRASVAATKAAAVLISTADSAALSRMLTPASAALWVIDHPYVQFARISQYFVAAGHIPEAAGVHPSSIVDPAADIDPAAHVAAGCVIGAGTRIAAGVVIGAGCILGAGVQVGAGTRLHARVTIYDGCSIGQRGIVHSGVVIGADGFGFAQDGPAWVKIPQTGGVVIGDDVEIGANTTIDRGAMADTVIGNDVKLDNQIQIGHNVRIGDHTAMAGCVGIAGSTTIGSRCQVGGAAIILGHLTIADGVVISAATVVSHSVLKPAMYTGFYPMAENSAWERSAAIVRNLDRLRARVRALEKQLKNGESSE